jgi:GNAT superfamily N-acetyltransferase
MLGTIHRLRDGTAIELRPLQPTDRDELVRGFEHLSPASRYRRFLAGIHHLSDGALRALFDVDGDAHLALVAVDVDGERERGGIGIARSIRDPDDRELAEYAIVVTDAWQRRGVGKLLTRALARLAWEHGIRRWKATMLIDNAPVRRLLESMSRTWESRAQGGGVLEAVYTLEPARFLGETASAPAERTVAG